MLNRRGLGRALAAGALGAAASPAGRAAAQQGDYPNRPVAVVVPWAPDGSSDAFGRVLAARCRRSSGARS